MAKAYRDGMTGGSREERLSEAFVDLADTLVDDFDVLDFLHTLATHCIALLDVDEAGLMLADGSGRLVVTASSTEQVRAARALRGAERRGAVPRLLRER